MSFPRALAVAVLALAGGCSGARSGCPASVPDNGSPCDHPGLSCEWGGDAHRRCAVFAECASDVDPAVRWFVNVDPGCVPENSPSCPASFGAAAGMACPVEAACDYAEGRCDCLPCLGPGAANAWFCRRWDDLPAGCPTERPLTGSDCSSEGLACTYEQCCGISFGPLLECRAGSWTAQVDMSCACFVPKCG